MEGDAGASSRLNLTDADDSSLSEVTPKESADSAGGADQTSTVVTPKESTESAGGADQTSTEVTPEESADSAGGADVVTPETADVVTPETVGDDDAEPDAAPDPEGDGAAISDAPAGSRLGRGWFVAAAVFLLLLAGGVGFAGFMALRDYRESQTIARNDAAALRAAEDCVAATQAPDTAAMADAARRIIECSTGDFGAQAALYSGMLTEAYQAANVHVQVSDMRAAVERNNRDGSVNVLVAMRTKVSNIEAQNQEQGFRLRVTMTPADGQWKISKLDQVAK